MKFLHSIEPTTVKLNNRPGAKIGMLGTERKAKGTITMRMHLTSNSSVDRPRVLEFGLKEVLQRDERKGSADKNADHPQNNMGRTKKSKKKKKKSKKRDADGKIIPDVVPLTGFDRRGIGTTPARHNGTESIPKSPEQRKKERDRVPGKMKIRMQLPNIKVARKWIYVLIEYFPNIVTFLHTTREQVPENDEDDQEDEMESVFTNVTIETKTEEEQRIESKEDQTENQTEDQTEKQTEKQTEDKTEDKIEEKKVKKTKRIKVHRKKKKEKKEKKEKNQVVEWENSMKAFFSEISNVDGAGVKFNLQSLLHMIMDTRHEGRMKYKQLPRLSDESKRTMRQWKPLKLLLSPKTYKKGIKKLIKKEDRLKKYKHIQMDWNYLVTQSGLISKAAKYKMQHRDGTRKEMITAAEVQRQKNRIFAQIAREKREEREKKEKQKMQRRKEQEKKQAARTKVILDRESKGQAEREAEMGVPHEHLCISITGDQQPYCPVCRQLAWQTAQLKWRTNENQKRDKHNHFIQEMRENEIKDRKKNKMNIRLATSTPVVQQQLKKCEKKRRKLFLKTDENLVQYESARRDEWNHADEGHRTKERFLRPVEQAALRTHTEHRATWLQAVQTFRDRTRIARLLWQKLLDKKSSFSSGNMRHLVWDESYEQFRICHFLACVGLNLFLDPNTAAIDTY